MQDLESASVSRKRITEYLLRWFQNYFVTKCQIFERDKEYK